MSRLNIHITTIRKLLRDGYSIGFIATRSFCNKNELVVPSHGRPTNHKLLNFIEPLYYEGLSYKEIAQEVQQEFPILYNSWKYPRLLRKEEI